MIQVTTDAVDAEYLVMSSVEGTIGTCDEIEIGGVEITINDGPLFIDTEECVIEDGKRLVV